MCCGGRGGRVEVAVRIGVEVVVTIVVIACCLGYELIKFDGDKGRIARTALAAVPLAVSAVRMLGFLFVRSTASRMLCFVCATAFSVYAAASAYVCHSADALYDMLYVSVVVATNSSTGDVVLPPTVTEVFKRPLLLNSLAYVILSLALIYRDVSLGALRAHDKSDQDIAERPRAHGSDDEQDAAKLGGQPKTVAKQRSKGSAVLADQHRVHDADIVEIGLLSAQERAGAMADVTGRSAGSSSSRTVSGSGGSGCCGGECSGTVKWDWARLLSSAIISVTISVLMALSRLYMDGQWQIGAAVGIYMLAPGVLIWRAATLPPATILKGFAKFTRGLGCDAVLLGELVFVGAIVSGAPWAIYGTIYTRPFVWVGLHLISITAVPVETVPAKPK